jgi:hypothetical protein
MLVLAAVILAVALLIRVVNDGLLAQYSGTALYASMVWAGVVFLRPRISPLTAGAVAIGICWLVELSQLTGVPATLSARSLVARLVLGAQFDWTDMAWYPVGVVPLVAGHWLIRTRCRPGSHLRAC